MNKAMNTRLHLAPAVFSLAATLAGGAMAETIALYTFEGGTVGEAVTTIPNAANPGTYTATAHRLGTEALGFGDAPYWTNNVPGNCVWSDASCTQMLARAPMAIHFSTNGVDTKLGGCLDMDRLAQAICNGESFTVECFWRSAAYVPNGSVASMKHDWEICIGAGNSSKTDSAVKMFGKNATPNGNKPINHGGSTDTRTLATYGWRHWALVYDAISATATFYFDYEPYDSFTTNSFTCTSSRKNAALRFGARMERTSSDSDFYVGYSCFNGELSCVRVSGGVLGVDDFMRMGVSAYYPFKDGSAGDTANTITNATVAGAGDGAAGHIGENGGTPSFSTDSPGRYIYSSFAKDELLCEEPGSLSFPKASGSLGMGYVSIPGLAGRLLMMTREGSGATFECFFKKEEGTGGNLNLLSFSPSDGNWRAYADTEATVSKQQSHNTVVAGTEGENLSGDGLWHHLAIVLDENTSSAKHWKTATVFIDYAQPTNATLADGVYWHQEDYWNTWSDLPFVIGMNADLTEGSGNRAFVGKISSVRVTSKALTPERFMVASDTTARLEDGRGFRWRFEDGATGAEVSSVADAGENAEKWMAGGITAYGSPASTPSYSTARPASVVEVDGVETNNALSVLMAANAGESRAVLENKLWSGAPALHPGSWTMEFFFKSGAERLSDALLAGRGRLNPSTGAEWSDWALAIQPDGKLALSGFRDDGAGGKMAYSYANLGISLDDGKWHRVEVVYNGALESFQVWADDAKVLDQALGSAQIDTSNARYQFGAGCCLASFGGNIDEVRFVGRVLGQSEFARLKNAATFVVFR